MTEGPSDDVVRNSGQVAVWTLVSRATGFARVLAISMVLGATFTGNLFQLANQLPWILYELAAGSLIASLLVPVLVEALRDSVDHARVLVGQFASAMAVVFVGVAILFVVGSPILLAAVTRDVSADSVDRARDIGFLLVALTGPQLVMYGLIAVAVAAQNASGRFAFAAAAPAIENIIVLVAILVYAASATAGAEIGVVSRTPLLLLALASTAGAFVHMVCQLIAAHRVGLGIRLTRHIDTQEIRSMAGRARQTSATAAFAGLRQFVLLVVSGSVAGGIVAYQLAVSFLNLPIALGARPVATAQLPALSHLALNDDRDGFVASYLTGVSLASVVTIPAALAMAVFAPSLARGLAIGELSDAYGQSLLLAAVAGIALGVVGEALYQVASHGSYARLDSNAPLRGMTVRLVLTAIAGGVLVVVSPSAAWLVFLLGLAASASDVVGALMLHRHVASWAPSRQLRSVAPSTLVSVLCIVPAGAIAWTLTDRWSSPPLSTTIVVFFGAVSSIGAVALLARSNDAVIARGGFR